MAKKNKSRGRKSSKKSVNSDLNLTNSHSNSEEYVFDDETLALAGGDVELLQDIRRMIVDMDDSTLKSCVENLKSGGMPVEAVWNMIMESNNRKSSTVNTGDNKKLSNHETETEAHEGKGLNKGEENFDTGDASNGLVHGGEQCQESDEFEGREFSIDLELPNTFFDPYKLHDALFKVLRICTFDSFDERIYDLFTVIAVLCDPYTQPCDSGKNNEMILSADLVSDLIIGIMFDQYIEVDSSSGKVTNLPAFEMAFDLAKIIEKICVVLNIDDENVLMYVKNDAQNWESELYKWLPQDTFSNMTNIASDYHHMMLLYTITTAALLTISKLYNSSGNVCLNPFLSLYLQLWKNLSKVILLGIEVDCRDEENGFPGYPEVIRYVIKGSSAVRSMISLILNDEFERRVHDLEHESLVNFMRPWGRKFSNGSIKVDMRVFVAALLALGSELDSVTELLFGFVPEDRYDEDVKYMFEMELEDMNGGGEEGNDHDRRYMDDGEDIGDGRKRYIGDNVIVEIEREGRDDDDSDGSGGGEDDVTRLNDESEGTRIEDGKNGNYMVEKFKVSNIYDLHPDCNCEFEDFESDVEYDDEEEGEEGDVEVDEGDIELINQLGEIAAGEGIEDVLSVDVLRNINNGPSALRYNQPKNVRDNDEAMIDSKGRDWRDIPRGKNNILSDQFVKLLKESADNSTIFITRMDKLIDEMKMMSEEFFIETRGEKIVRSVAWVVQYERESMMMDEEEREKSDDNINADVIYNFLKNEERFIDMTRLNPELTFCIIDELLMAEGYRRAIIWFLSHLPLNQWIINYIHELLIGKRGEECKKYEFSRVGKIELSEVEKTMLLHEFFSNSVIFLSHGENGRSSKSRNEAYKIIKMICLMLKSLEANGVLNSEGENSDEYRVEIQTLLFQWVGVTSIPEARELFFKFSKTPKMESNFNKVLNRSTDGNGGSSNDSSSISISASGNDNVVYDSSEKWDEMATALRKEDKSENIRPNQQMHNIFQALNNFDGTTIFMISLNIAAEIGSNKDENEEKCFKFFQDLNSMTGIYQDNEELGKDCFELFTALNNKLIERDVEGIIKVARKFGILFEDDDKARKVTETFMQERYEILEQN